MAAQQDFWGQFEVVEYDKPQYDWGQFEQVPQNKHALETSLNELPKNDPYVKTQKHQTEQLANMLFTAEERKAIENKGEIGWWEYAKNYADLSEAVPFYGTGKQIAQTSKVYSIAKKLENGEEVTAADKSYMQDYLKKYTETQLRGTSWGAKGASMLIQAPAFIGEFIATAGVGATVGKGAVIAGVKGAGAAATKAAIKAGTKVATSKALSTIAGEQAVKTIGTKAALETSAKLAGKAATQQAVLVPMYAVQNYNEKKIADGLNLTDKGSDVLYNTQKADSSASWAKSFGIGEIEILSEMSGGLLGYMAGGVTRGITTAATKIGGKVATTNAARGISAVSAKVYNSIPKEARIKLEAAARLTDKLGKKLNTASEKLKQPSIGFHGVAEEMGEERFGDVLKYAFDLDENEGYLDENGKFDLDQLGSAIFPGWQQLLLEAGVFSIVGGGSFATRTVINNLKEKGYSDKEATTISQNLSEIEKENIANEILGEVKINEDIKDQEVIKEQVKIENAMLKGGISITENTQENTTEKQKAKTLSDYKKDILSNKFEDKKLDTIKGSYKNSYYTKTLPTLNNDIIEAERGFNKLINEIHKNPSLVNDTAEVERIEKELENITDRLPQEEELIYPYYEKFYNAINSANEYLEAKKKKSEAAELYDIEEDYSLENNIQNIKPIVIDTKNIPELKTKKDIQNWVSDIFSKLGTVKIKSTGIEIKLTKSSANRETNKRRVTQEEHRAVFEQFKELVENSIKVGDRAKDEIHKHNQEIYMNKFQIGDNVYDVNLFFDKLEKNNEYRYAGHSIKIAPSPTQSLNDIQTEGATNIIPQSEKNTTPSELYDISDKAPKKTEVPITQEAETVEDELEVPETVADKIIRGESKFGKLYTEWVDRYTPIENLVKKAEQKTGEKLDISSNPYFQARMYAGLVESIKEQVNDKTFVKENGKIKITGEGFLPIINDYVEQIKDVEPNYDKAIEDLSDYLIANRYLLDLKDRDGYEATEEQKLKAVSDMTKLNLKYGDKIEDISKIADRIYAFNQRILHNLVDSGNMSQETYDKIIEQNPHHISYKRVMDDNGIGQDFFAKPKFTDAKSPIKKIRGSERDIQNIFVSTLEDVSRILDTAERNKVARSVANLKDILPEYIEERKPAMEKRTAKVKVTYDAKMRSQLEEAIKFFGRTFKNVKSIKTPTGYALGSYSEEEKEVRKKLGSQDRTLAHEVGHMLDFALDVENQIKNNSKIMQELKTLAEDRFKSTVKLQDGEFITEDAGSPEKYKKYVQSNKEAIANAFDLYFTSRDYVKRVAPETAKFIDNLFKGEYAFLNEIRPSSETATEEIEQDVWTPSRNKPYGNVIQYFENGKPKFVEVTKPVMDAVEGMNSQEIDFINKFMVGSASMLRTGATITPEFAIRNFIRDQESAVIYIKNYNPFIDGVKGLFNVLGKKITGKNKTYDEWVKAGGAFGSYMELNEKSVNKALKEFVGEGSKMRNIFSYANPLKLAEEFSSIFEQATRLGIYTRSKMNGSSAMQAALEAREGTLDFGRSGSLGRKYNRILPFFNAGIQGVDKMVRTFRDHPYLSTMKAVGTITLPQLAVTGYYLYFAPDDDREEYLNIPQYQKDFFYCFKVGKNWVRIPKDFTLGYVFGSVPERFLTWAYQNKKPEGKDLAEMAMTLFGSVSPVNNPTDVLPPILRTAIEDIANYSFFRNQHIYPEYMNSLEPSLRANKFNSETSKILGEKLNISPAKIDHTIGSLLGTSGRYLTDAGDLIINSVREFNGEKTPEKVKTLADAPFLRGFVLRDPIGYQAVSTNEFFENYKTVSEKHATYNKYKKTDREKAREYKEEHSAELKAYKKMNDTKKRISEIGKQMDKIYSDKTMTSKEKQEKLQPLAKRISDMAFDANVWYGNYKE